MRPSLHILSGMSIPKYSSDHVTHSRETHQRLLPSWAIGSGPPLPLSLHTSSYLSLLSCICPFSHSSIMTVLICLRIFDLLFLLLKDSFSAFPLAACLPHSALSSSPSPRDSFQPSYSGPLVLACVIFPIAPIGA